MALESKVRVGVQAFWYDTPKSANSSRVTSAELKYTTYTVGKPKLRKAISESKKYTLFSALLLFSEF